MKADQEKLNGADTICLLIGVSNASHIQYNKIDQEIEKTKASEVLMVWHQFVLETIDIYQST